MQAAGLVSIVVAIWRVSESADTGTSDLCHISVHCSYGVIEARQAGRVNALVGLERLMCGLHALFAVVVLCWSCFSVGSDSVLSLDRINPTNLQRRQILEASKRKP